MAKTYSAIQTFTLTGTTSSITFSNIPQNYTDLKIVVSARSTRSDAFDYLDIQFNGNTSGVYSTKVFYGNGTSTGSFNYSAVNGITAGIVDGTGNTSNTFGNTEIYIPNYSSTNYKSVSSECVNEDNSSGAYITYAAGLFSVSGSTSVISTINLFLESGSFVSGSTITLYGIGSGAKATGGTVVGAGNYIYHTFTASGTFTPTEQIKNAEVVLVAGGGGGSTLGGGGGGAGGLLYLPGNTFIAGTSYTCTVGAGGANSSSATTSGANSVLGSLPAAIGGGAGGSFVGLSGGSGGGNAANTSAAAALGTPGQGNNGGRNNQSYSSPYYAGGGGGGAGGVGGDAPTNQLGGTGGIGSSSYTPWLYATQQGVNIGGVFYIAGGGGGGTGRSIGVGGAGGYGGGGAGASVGSSTNAVAGTANTGGGGGGGNSDATSGAGGSGLVIIRYPVN